MAQYLSKEGAYNLSEAIRAYIDSVHGTSLLKSQLGASNGVAPLDGNKLIPSSYLPAYVDDVKEYANYASLPASSQAETGKIYVTLDDGKTYRWGGTAYVEISASLAIGESADTAFAGNRGKTLEGYFLNGIVNQAAKVTNALTVGGKTYNGSSAVEITKSDLGLGNVENTKLSTWSGTSNITTLGTIKTGVWNGTAISVNFGGTGLTSYTAGDMLYASNTTTLAKVSSSSFGRSLLGATSGTKFAGLYAEKAHRDGNDNTITSTYMPFSGGTFTGTVTHNANIILANSKVIVSKDTSGNDMSLLVVDGDDHLMIGYGTKNKHNTNIYGKNIFLRSGNGVDALKIGEDKLVTAFGNIHSMGGVSAKGIADFGISGGGSTGGGTSYSINIVPSTNKVSIQLNGGDGTSSTKDIAAFSLTRAGVVPNAPSASSILRGNGWGTLAFSEVTGKPTTISGYGITDLSLSVDAAYDWDANDDIDAQSYGYNLTVGSKSFAMSAMTKTEVSAIISKYFS